MLDEPITADDVLARRAGTLPQMDPVEWAVVGLVERLGTRSDKFVRSEHILDELQLAETPGTRAELYARLVRMARPGSVMLPLLEGRGNFGSPSDPPADPPYTECRLTAAAAVVLEEGVGDEPGLPIDLINGDMSGGGERPSFDPDRVLGAALRLLEEPGTLDAEVAAAVGAPVFPTGCEVEGRIDALLAGESVLLLLSARTTVAQDQRGRVLVLSGLPPEAVPDDVVSELFTRFYRYPYPDKPAWVESSFSGVHWRGDPSSPVIEAVFAPSADEQEVMDRITSVDGVADQYRAQLPEPAAATLRSWIAALGTERARRNIDQVRRAPSASGPPPHR